MTVLPFRCRFDEALIHEYAEGAIEQGKAALVRDHLGGCSDCSETLRFFSLRHRIVPSCAPPVPGEILRGFADDVMDEVQNRPCGKPVGWRLLRFGTGVAAALLIGLSFLIGSAPRPRSDAVASLPVEKTGIVAIETPLSGLFASPDQDVVMIVLDTDEEL